MEKNRNYYKLNMDFLRYNFSEFSLEYNDKKDYKYKRYKEIEWCVKTNKIKENDIVYIYCFNMPDMRNRFVMKAIVKTVIEKEKTDNITKKRFIAGYNKMLILKDIKALDVKDNYLFSKEDLKENYNFYAFEGSYGLINNNELIKDLENTKTCDVQNLLDSYVNANCFFEDIKLKGDSKNYSHSSFVKDNGVNYVEYHHFIFRSISNQNKELNKDIHCIENFVKLCPTCHRKIHYGKMEIRKQMIDCILEKCNKEKLTDLISKIPNNTKNLHDYVYDLYKINL